jgi:hypothetical protein
VVSRASFDKVRCDELPSQRQNAYTQNWDQQLADESGRNCRSLVHDEIINSRIDRRYLVDWLPGWLRIILIIAAARPGNEVGPCRRLKQNSLPVEPSRVLDCRGNLVAAAKRQGKPWLPVAMMQRFHHNTALAGTQDSFGDRQR